MKYVAVIMTVILVILSVRVMIQDIDIKNLELKQCKLEQYCNIIIEENKALQRINEQNLSMLAEGGWDDFHSDVSGD